MPVQIFHRDEEGAAFANNNDDDNDDVDGSRSSSMHDRVDVPYMGDMQWWEYLKTIICPALGLRPYDDRTVLAVFRVINRSDESVIHSFEKGDRFKKVSKLFNDGCTLTYTTKPKSARSMSEVMQEIYNRDFFENADGNIESPAEAKVNKGKTSKRPRAALNYGERSLFEEGKEYDGKSNKECPVCLREFEQDDGVTIFSCQHMYHNCCIAMWVKTLSTARKPARCTFRCKNHEPLRIDDVTSGF